MIRITIGLLTILLVMLCSPFGEVALLAFECNNEKPENPAPSCGDATGTCEGHALTGCPFLAGCDEDDLLRNYREKLAKECEDGGPGDHCSWAEDDTLCYTVTGCRVGGILPPRCMAGVDCQTVDDSWRESPECEEPDA